MGAFNCGAFVAGVVKVNCLLLLFMLIEFWNCWVSHSGWQWSFGKYCRVWCFLALLCFFALVWSLKVLGLLFPFLSAVVPVYCVSMPLSFSFSGYFMKLFHHISGSNSFHVLFWSHELSGLTVNSSEFLIVFAVFVEHRVSWMGQDSQQGWQHILWQWRANHVLGPPFSSSFQKRYTCP